jgi:tetrahydrodipicolinate N-succinyltransferase
MITIEDGVLLAGSDHILSHSFFMNGIEDEGFNPVIIKEGARIGARVLILAGVTIGEGSVIGAGAVVVNDIPPHCLAVGVPAKPIRYFKQQQVDKSSKDGMLFLKCKKCNIEFWSAIRCNKKKIHEVIFDNNSHMCPNGHKAHYKKNDYYFKD